MEKALVSIECRNVKGNIPDKQEGESKSAIYRQNFIEEQSNDKELLDFEFLPDQNMLIRLISLMSKLLNCQYFENGTR